nr:hypothetical protein [Chloroflexota bacterium]
MHRQRFLLPLLTLVLGLLAACGGEVDALPTHTPEAQTGPARSIESQSQALLLRLNSPNTNLITNSGLISVAGVTSPDATLSINGRLVLPDPEGLFSTDLELSSDQNLHVIDVTATSIFGETETEVRPVIFLNEPAVQSALFGTITAVTPVGFTMDTDDGSVTLAADDTTKIRIHGWDSPSHTNLAKGTLVAVVARGQHADSALAVLTRPAQTRHFTGIVTTLGSNDSTGSGSLTLQDSSGREITAAIEGALAESLQEEAPMGSVITVVLEQSLVSDDLIITGIDPALDAASRIFDALTLNQSIDSPDASSNISGLRWRLAEHGVSNISMLFNSQEFEGVQEAIEQADEAYTKIFSEHHIGAPAADVTGLVTAIATSIGTSSTRLITVQPDSGQPIKVKISGTTPVALFGERIRSGQLDLASRITVRYGILGNNASRVTVMGGNTLSEESSIQLAERADRGEIQGTLMEVGPLAALITILDRDTGQQVSLRSSGASGATVTKGGMPVDLTPSMEGSRVVARFDPGSYRLMELESLPNQRNQETLSGVVHSFIPKVARGNITIRMSDGRLQSFSHDTSTLIRREGLNVSIHEVRLGDLVRPNTRVTSSVGSNSQPQELVFLSLKAPEPELITGLIRGVTRGLNGQVQVTVSDIWLDLISLTVNSETAISQQGQALGAQDLAVGQGIALGSYDPVTLELGVLALDPPKTTERANV